MATATAKPKPAARPAPAPDPSFTDDIVDDAGQSVVARHDDVVDDSGRAISATPSAPPAATSASRLPSAWPSAPPSGELDDKTLGGFVANIPRSAGEMASGLWTMVAHPLDTVGNVDRVIAGGEQRLARTMGINPAEHQTLFGVANEAPIFDAFLSAMKARYGGAKAIGNTLYHDPVGAALDVSGLFSGGATAMGERLPATARFLARAAELTDPIRGTGKLIAGTGKLAGWTGAEIAGKSTGVGADTIRTAANAADHPNFKPAMRGALDHEDALGQVKGALGDLVDRRRAAYQSQLAQLPVDVELDLQPARDAMAAALDDFGITVKKGGKKGPTLDFSRSTLRNIGPETAKVQAMFDDLTGWGTRPSDLTPLGMDRLKQGLSTLISASPGRGDAIVTRVTNAVRDTLNAGVPGYSQMTSDYAKASQFLDEVSAELSASPTTAKGTGIRKLTTALNQRNDYRRALIDTLDSEFGTDIRGTIAGAEMRSPMPRGIIGPLGLAAGGAELLPRMGHFISDPKALLAMLAGSTAFSPRVVGETLAAISSVRSSRVAQAGGQAAGAAARVVFNPRTYRFAKTANDAAGTEIPPPPEIMREWLDRKAPGGATGSVGGAGNPQHFPARLSLPSPAAGGRQSTADMTPAEIAGQAIAQHTNGPRNTGIDDRIVATKVRDARDGEGGIRFSNAEDAFFNPESNIIYRNTRSPYRRDEKLLPHEVGHAVWRQLPDFVKNQWQRIYDQAYEPPPNFTGTWRRANIDDAFAKYGDPENDPTDQAEGRGAHAFAEITGEFVGDPEGLKARLKKMGKPYIYNWLRSIYGREFIKRTPDEGGVTPAIPFNWGQK